MSIKAFGDLLTGLGRGAEGIGRHLAQRLDVPFYEDRDERLLGHCLKEDLRRFQELRDKGMLDASELFPTRRFRFATGEILCTNKWPDRLFKEENEQLTEEVWSHDHWPDSCNDIDGAIDKLPSGVTGIYWHAPSLNLILVGPGGVKVGIRSVCLTLSPHSFSRLRKYIAS